MKQIRLSPSANEELDGVVQAILDRLPNLIGASEVNAGCVVTSLGTGSSLPRLISVRINDYIQQVLWRGYPAIGVGDEVSVFHFREGNRYEILAVSGDSGYQEIGATLRSVWVFDVSETVVVGPYSTINDALSYAPLASGDYVLIGAGIYDEEITLIDGVIITEIIPGTVIINSTLTDTAVNAADGGYIQVKEIRCTRSGTDNAYGVDVTGLAYGESCEIRAELIRAENATADTGAEVMGIRGDGAGAGTTTIYSDIEGFGNGSNPFAIVCAICVTDDIVHVFGNCKAEATGSPPSETDCFFGLGAGSIYIHGDATAVGGTTVSVAYDVAFIDMVGDAYAYSGTAGAWVSGFEEVDTLNLHGDVLAYGDGAGCEVYGILMSTNGSPGNTVKGIVQAESVGANTTIGVETIGTTPIVVYGTVIGTGTAGNRYAVDCDGGVVSHYAGYAYGDTLDYNVVSGAVETYMVQYVSYSGALVSSYPLPDQGWIGLAGGAGARLEFNDDAPDDVVLHDGILTLPNTGLHLLDTNASHDLIIKPGSDLTADRTLTIITGDSDRSITFANSGTVALGAGTLSVSSINDATLASHTHAITTSSNPGAVASILATNASGFIQLTGLGIGTAATTTVAFNMYKSITMAAAAVHTAASYNIRAYGDAAGTSILRGTSFIADLRGANNIAEGTAFQCDTYNQMDGGTTLTYQLGCISTVRVYTSANTTNATSYRATARLGSTGNITSYWAGFEVFPITFDSSGTVNNVFGLYVRNLGNALITATYGIYVESQSGSGSNYAIYTNTGIVRFGDDVWITGQKELRFYEGANYVGFEAPALSANQIWVLPDADGSADDVLQTDGAGNLSWATLSFGDLSLVYTSATSVTLNTGSSASVVADLQTMLDGNVYHIDEVAGVPGFDLEVNFTSIAEISAIYWRAYYNGTATHGCRVQLYNYNTTTWDTYFTELGDELDYSVHFIPVQDDSDYISSGNAKIRFYHTESGNASHDMYIDYVALVS